MSDTRKANAELLAKLQSEGRAPKIGETVTRTVGSHTNRYERVKVEAVSARALKYGDRLYVTADGKKYAGAPTMKGWTASCDTGSTWSFDSIGPFDAKAHAQQDEERARRSLREDLADAAKGATSKQLRAALAALGVKKEER